MNRSLLLVFSSLMICPCGLPLRAAEPPLGAVRTATELRRFPAGEANQGVAVDATHFFAISNSEIGKYRKDDGSRVSGWKADSPGPIKHLNAGIVLEGRLYCAHSNFPARPEESSIEVFDAATMAHVERHAFDHPPGSLTWIAPRQGEWFACFAHYAKSSDPALSQVVRFDGSWRIVQAWSFPPGLIVRFGGSSSSGGAFGPGGQLCLTGHDARELYVVDLPPSGKELIWRDTIPLTTAGQAFAWDPADASLLYTIERKTREVVISKIAEQTATDAEFESLQDGKSFAGWRHGGNWIIEDGSFYRKDKGGPLTYVVKSVPDDFDLRFDWKVSKGCNSGVYYRPGQYEYQILDNGNSPYAENPRQTAAALYFCMAPSKDATKPAGEWNEGRIVCKGSVIQHWLNGEKVVDFDYTDPRWEEAVELLRLRGADLTARGGNLWLQDHGQPVWFRNLRLRTIPAGESLPRSTCKPIAMPAAALKKQVEHVAQLLRSAVGANPAGFRSMPCDGVYPRHLQGLATDGKEAIFWSWTEALVKTDLQGRIQKQIPAADHHGDLCYRDGKVYVAVNLGKFNKPPGKESSWVYVYDGGTLNEIARHPVPELVHGAGGIGCQDGRFLVVGGLPPGVNENYLYEYDANFAFLGRHILASGHTDMGIQTAEWAHGAWWFGCYGKPRVLLRADENYRLTGRWYFDASYGLDPLPDGRLLIGRSVAISNQENAGHVQMARTDPNQGVVLEFPPVPNAGR